MPNSMTHRNTSDCPVHIMGTGNHSMDNSRFIIIETFQSETETERKENLQRAVDQYIRLVLKNGSLPTGNLFSDLVK